jgi:Tautomerase enzyme
MPHVIVKLWPGKSEQKKKKLAAEITKAVMSNVHAHRTITLQRRAERAPQLGYQFLSDCVSQTLLTR